MKEIDIESTIGKGIEIEIIIPRRDDVQDEGVHFISTRSEQRVKDFITSLQRHALPRSFYFRYRAWSSSLLYTPTQAGTVNSVVADVQDRRFNIQSQITGSHLYVQRDTAFLLAEGSLNCNLPNFDLSDCLMKNGRYVLSYRSRVNSRETAEQGNTINGAGGGARAAGRRPGPVINNAPDD
ncbi:hypothetical protein EVAR_97893_1 [Eumeta japonica]|uniref:Uncharacterized protein n=1 Tax=Eumeta variegata TaxID=151549 RepID=A0A4C1WDX1_EUMVA|nr:hypothetical protein EVAR_97893_1 [Eumeta japonica]